MPVHTPVWPTVPEVEIINATELLAETKVLKTWAKV